MCKTEAWFFGYGSLIFEPEYKGRELTDWCEPPIDGTINKGIEFWHTSKTRGGAPTLCFDGTARLTKGKCWRTVGKRNTEEAKRYLESREGKIKNVEVSLVDGGKVIAYCGDTAPDLKGKSAEELAQLAIESERICPDRGGIAYITKCKKIGVVTPLIDEILKHIKEVKNASSY